jgi:hypothetical protein
MPTIDPRCYRDDVVGALILLALSGGASVDADTPSAAASDVAGTDIRIKGTVRRWPRWTGRDGSALHPHDRPLWIVVRPAGRQDLAWTCEENGVFDCTGTGHWRDGPSVVELVLVHPRSAELPVVARVDVPRDVRRLFLSVEAEFLEGQPLLRVTRTLRVREDPAVTLRKRTTDDRFNFVLENRSGRSIYFYGPPEMDGVYETLIDGRYVVVDDRGGCGALDGWSEVKPGERRDARQGFRFGAPPRAMTPPTRFVVRYRIEPPASADPPKRRVETEDIWQAVAALDDGAPTAEGPSSPVQ